MKQTNRFRHNILALFLLAASPTLVCAAVQVEAGSGEHEILIRVGNPGEEPLEGVTATLLSSTPLLHGLRIEPDRIEKLDIDETTEFTVRFSIAENAPEGATETLVFEVDAEWGWFEEPIQELTIEIVAVEEDEDEAEDAEDDSSTVTSTWYIVQVTGGGFIPHWSGASFIKEGFVDLPVEIRSDSGTTIEQEVERLRAQWDQPPNCANVISDRMALSQGPPRFWGSGPNVARRAGPLTEEQFSSEPVEEDWRLLGSDGPSFPELLKRFCGVGGEEGEVPPPNVVETGIDTDSGDTAGGWVGEEGTAEGNDDGDAVPGTVLDPSDDPTSGSVPDPSATDAESGVPTVTGGAGVTAGTQPGSVLPAIPPQVPAINPRQPDIAALIREWIAIAEPPVNATQGANLHYNEWGVMLGQAAGGVIRGTPGKPDDVGARTPPEYLWGLRDALDSVDHCLLGEYVESRLAGQDISHCRGRYRGVVDNLAGRSEGTARKAIEHLRWFPTVYEGDDAPSPELAGTVQKQRPEAGTPLARGERVDIWIWREELIALPDLIGQTEEMATAWLEELGLRVMLQPGGAAPSPGDVDHVARQHPVPGTPVAAGSAVTLATYEQATVVVPNLIGKSSAMAISWLEELGLRATAEIGSAAASSSQSGTVASQSTPAGSRVASGEFISLTIFGDFVPPPEVRPTTFLDCRRWPGTIVEADLRTGKRSCQCPPGSAWSKVQGRCLGLPGSGSGGPPISRTPSCSHMPGTIPDPSGGCRCPVGEWNAAQRRCVDTDAIDRQREIEEQRQGTDCERLYSEIRTFFSDPSGVHRQMAVDAERKARAMGCDAGRIDAAIDESRGRGRKRRDEERPRVPPAGPIQGGGTVPSGGGGTGGVTDGGGASSCKCRVDTSSMRGSNAFCSHYREIKNAQGQYDVYGDDVVHHIVNDDIVRSGHWQPPTGWHRGDYNTCEYLLDVYDCSTECRGAQPQDGSGASAGAGSGAPSEAEAGDGSPAGSGVDCDSVGLRLSEALVRQEVTRQAAEQQMREAGCGDEFVLLCPQGTFAQASYPECLD